MIASFHPAKLDKENPMTRQKRARRVGSEGPAQYTEKTLTKQDIAAIARKKQSKRKGLKAGSRHSKSDAELQRLNPAAKDPRIGSKKLVPLVVVAPAHPKSNAAKKERRLTAEQELVQLEQDVQLNSLLDRLDNGESLGAGLQDYVDQKLNRIEQLMKQLGIFEEAAEMDAPKAKKPKMSKEEALLARFENASLDLE